MKGTFEIESDIVERPQPRSTWQAIQTYFNVLNHLVASIVAVFMTFMCYNAGNRPISWHAWLCTIGYQLLMTQAILAFYSENVWSKQHTRQTQKTIHWILQAIGSTAAITGIVIEYIGRHLNSKAHFSSTHSTIGLIAVIFTFIGMINGISALWSVKLNKFVKPVYFKLAHNINGMIAFVLGMIALFFGYDKRYMKDHANPEIRLGLQALAISTVALTLIGAWRATLNHIRNVKN